MYNPSAVVLIILNKNLASSGLPHVVSILSEHKAYCFMVKTIMICFIYHISKIQFILCVFHRGSSADHSFREKIPTSEKNTDFRGHNTVPNHLQQLTYFWAL